MNDAELDALLAEDDDVYPLDSVELDAHSQSSGNQGGSSRSRPKRVTGGTTSSGEPVSYMGPSEAYSMLSGDTVNQDEGGDDDPFNTSCDELEDELEFGDDPDGIDALFSENPRPVRAAGRGRRRKKSPFDCFGCVFSSRGDLQSSADSHIDGQKMNDLLRIFDDNYGRIDSKVIARMCHLFFKSEIFTPLHVRGVNVPMWRTRDIYIHFRDHQYDPRIFLIEQIEDYRVLSRTLRRMSFAVTDGGVLASMDKTMAMYHRVNGHLLTLYKANPDSLNFHNPSHVIDFGTMGKHMGPQRNFAIEDE